METISIIIPLYILDEEVLEQARKCIKSIKDNTKNYELILIDNGGIMNSEEWKSLADVYVYNKVNVGYGPAINQGFKLAKGRFLCAMNDDVEVRTGWLPPLLEVFNNPLIGVSRPAEDREIGEGIKEDFTWYHGFCWIIKRELWQSMKDKDGNLLDEQFIIGYFEDVDLWQRILKRNYKLVKNFNTRVFHYGGLTIHKMGIEARKLENEAKFIAKHNMPNWREIFYP